jgi:hypothetical protein
MKLLVIDRRVALFPADPADFERGYLAASATWSPCSPAATPT